jgi:hypothetical protein
MASPTSAIKGAQAKEILKCGRDPIYFFNKYIKIQHPTKGALPFGTFPFQDDCVHDFLKHRFTVVLKARQLGLSTVTAAYALWIILFQENANVLVIATKLTTAKNFIAKCKYMLKNLPPWLILCDITSDTVQTIETSRGSILKAVPTSPDAGRSEALSLLIVDEAAFIENFDTLWTGLYPCVSTGGRTILLSSPNGTGNKFFDIYDKAAKGENEFYPIKLPWNVHPERDEKWFKQQTMNMTPKEIAQEHECDFAASGDTFIDASIIEKIRLMVKAPLKKVGEDRNVWIWEDPEPEDQYILSADTARGDGKDYSAFHIFNATTSRCVVEYKGKMPPDRFAEIINEFGLLYNKALVCPENNNIGYATIQRLCFLLYPNIYNGKEKSLDLWKSMAGNDGSLQRPSGDLGIFTTGQKKNVLLTKMEEMLRNDRIKIFSSRFYEELKTFVWINNNKVGAEKGKNDDLVMSAAIGLWLLDTADFSIYSEGQSKALIDAMTKSASSIDDIINNQTGKNKDDYSVMVPVAGNSGGFSNSNRARIQLINKKWNWLMK